MSTREQVKQVKREQERDEKRASLEAKKEFYRKQIYDLYEMEYARLCAERVIQNNKHKESLSL